MLSESVTLVDCAYGVNQDWVTLAEDIQQPEQTYAWKLFGDPKGLIHLWGAIPASSLQPPTASTRPTPNPFPRPPPRRLPRHDCHIPTHGRASQTPEGAVVLAGPPATTEPLCEVDVKGR